MARTADPSKTILTTADDLHEHDRIQCKDGSTLTVEWARSPFVEGSVTVMTTAGARWTVPADRLVRVFTEHECDCNGTGLFRWAGYTENGEYKGKQGPHYACAGKGWQDRDDVIRNVVYWNKYARIYA